MSFITVDDANSILGSDFAPDSDKARLVQAGKCLDEKTDWFCTRSN